MREKQARLPLIPFRDRPIASTDLTRKCTFLISRRGGQVAISSRNPKIPSKFSALRCQSMSQYIWRMSPNLIGPIHLKNCPANSKPSTYLPPLLLAAMNSNRQLVKTCILISWESLRGRALIKFDNGCCGHLTLRTSLGPSNSSLSGMQLLYTCGRILIGSWSKVNIVRPLSPSLQIDVANRLTG